MEGIIALIIVLFVFGFVIYLKAKAFYKNYQFRKENYSVCQSILRRKFSFYKRLKEKDQKVFINRVFSFIENHDFVGKQELSVTFKMKVWIAAAATQLTYGLTNYSLSKFKTIFLFKQAYKSKFTGRMHFGEVNMKGAIAFSWTNFMKGYEDGGDKVNLGLHEMAHALDLRRNSGFFKRVLEKFKAEAKKEIKRMKQGGNHFLNQYATLNTNEYFAVAIEHFFEAPETFRDELPNIYRLLCVLLNQDPAKRIYKGIDYRQYVPENSYKTYLKDKNAKPIIPRGHRKHFIISENFLFIRKYSFFPLTIHLDNLTSAIFKFREVYREDNGLFIDKSGWVQYEVMRLNYIDGKKFKSYVLNLYNRDHALLLREELRKRNILVKSTIADHVKI